MKGGGEGGGGGEFYQPVTLPVSVEEAYLTLP